MDFLTPWAGILVLRCGRVGDIVKMPCFFRDLLYFRHGWEGLVMISGEGSGKPVDSSASRRGFCSGAWPDRSYNDNA